LNDAMRIQALITPLKDAVYGAGEPTGEAHGRMKAAMALAGIIRDATVRPPTREPNAKELDTIRSALSHAGLLERDAA
jgi:4-hydroxy-tetrahydrodipicolinate synthase